MRWRAVDSSSVAAIGYEVGRALLLVEFRSSGAVYAYHGVPRRVFRELSKAASKGCYVNYRIKGRYSYERLPSRPDPGNAPERRR